MAVNYHYITVLCPFNLLIRFKCYNILININKYILHDLSIELRDNLYFSFSIPTPGFAHFYYMLDANLVLPLYGEVSVMQEKNKTKQHRAQTIKFINLLNL